MPPSAWTARRTIAKLYRRSPLRLKPSDRPSTARDHRRGRSIHSLPAFTAPRASPKIPHSYGSRSMDLPGASCIASGGSLGAWAQRNRPAAPRSSLSEGWQPEPRAPAPSRHGGTLGLSRRCSLPLRIALLCAATIGRRKNPGGIRPPPACACPARLYSCRIDVSGTSYCSSGIRSQVAGGSCPLCRWRRPWFAHRRHFADTPRPNFTRLGEVLTGGGALGHILARRAAAGA